MISIIHKSSPKIAILTYVHNEPFFFPIWIKHYSSIFSSEDIYVINNNSTDGSFEETQKKYTFNEIKFETEYNHDFYKLFDFIKIKIDELLSKYSGIYIAECDELLFHKDGLIRAASTYIKHRLSTVRCLSYEPVQIYFGIKDYIEHELDLKKPLLSQRKYWRESWWMRKCVFITENIPFYLHMHDHDDIYTFADYKLMMMHLKFIDFEQLWKRNELTIQKGNISPIILKNNFGWQNRLDKQTFVGMFLNAIQQSSEIPEKYRNLI